jgi:hypothetical protein
MQGHDGEGLALMLKTSEMKVSTFSQRMGVSRITPSRWAHMARLPDETLANAAKVLHLELADYIPRFARKAAQNYQQPNDGVGSVTIAESPTVAYNKNATPPATNLEECRAQVLHWQGKAYQNLEQYTKLLQLYMELVKKLPEGSYPALSADGQVLFPQNTSK